MPNPFTTPDETIIRTKIPVFAPYKIVEVDANAEWTPSTTDRAFISSVATTFTLGEGTSESVFINLLAGQVLGIKPGITFTFSTNVSLAVM